MAIYSWFTHWKWWCSIVMLVYQRVSFAVPHWQIAAEMGVNPMSIHTPLPILPRKNSPVRVYRGGAAVHGCGTLQVFEDPLDFKAAQSLYDRSWPLFFEHNMFKQKATGENCVHANERLARVFWDKVPGKLQSAEAYMVCAGKNKYLKDGAPQV